MTYTGGPLNYLYGQSRASNPRESIHVMNLIREHDPETPDDLYDEINRHHEESCSCGMSGGGTLEDYGEWLYEAQQDEWGEYRFSIDECSRWIYDLFVMQSLKGRNLEEQAKDVLGRSFTVEDAEGLLDDEYRVDLIIRSQDDIIAGLQVKPESYKDMRDAVHRQNDDAHAEIDEPIFYLYYDYDREIFTNTERVLSDLYELVNDE